MNNEFLELFNTIKKIVDNYLNNRKVATILIGNYNGKGIVLSDGLSLPLSIVSGNLKTKLVNGDKVRLMRGDGGKEYYILEIIDKPFAFYSEVQR